MDYDIDKDICIVGGGLSGITSARWAIESGYTVKIYDNNSELGGCWISKAYENVRLQSNKDSYSFSDYPMSEEYSDYPTRKQILENTLTDELKKYFRIVPQEKYEQVLEQLACTD